MSPPPPLSSCSRPSANAQRNKTDNPLPPLSQTNRTRCITSVKDAYPLFKSACAKNDKGSKQSSKESNPKPTSAFQCPRQTAQPMARVLRLGSDAQRPSKMALKFGMITRRLGCRYTKVCGTRRRRSERPKSKAVFEPQTQNIHNTSF